MLPPSPSTLSCGRGSLSSRLLFGRLPFIELTRTSSVVEFWLLTRDNGGRLAAGRSDRDSSTSAGDRGRLAVPFANAAEAALTAEPTLVAVAALACETFASSSSPIENERLSGDAASAVCRLNPFSSTSRGSVRCQLGMSQVRFRGVSPVGSSSRRLPRKFSVVSLISSILRFADR